VSVFAPQFEAVEQMIPQGLTGTVDGITGMRVSVGGLRAPVGAMCDMTTRTGRLVQSQVVGFRGDQALLMPLGDVSGVSKGDAVRCRTAQQTVAVGGDLLGRVINGMGEPIDEGGSLCGEQYYPLFRQAPEAMSRLRIDEPLGTGIRSMDGLLTAGRGQRLGIFAGTGVGKSVLMGMIARYTSADVTVVALVGERGREVGDFLRKDLGKDGLKRSVVIVSTSDESPVLRVRATFLATAVAEYFRDQGADVLLLVDSLTRLAMAQRQIGLAAEEPPATKGYTPSVFAMLPQLLERSGRTEAGSITGFYTVLVEGDDINEPISDAVRGALDGHVWLSRGLANRGHYPAVSVLESISRVMIDVVDDEQMEAARTVSRVLAVWRDIEDLVNIGAYARGTNSEYDLALDAKPLIDAYLRQGIAEHVGFEEAKRQLLELNERITELAEKARGRRGASAVAAGDGPT
jgi:flagellum-specific ATP synthase